jgi:hypothetical protein
MQVANVQMDVWTVDGKWSTKTDYASLKHVLHVIEQALTQAPRDWNNVRITMSRVNDLPGEAVNDSSE